MDTVITNYEIPFFDVDAYRIVWHGNYPKYFEIARCHLLEVIGIPYAEMEKNGYFFPIVDMHIKYIKPLVFGQKVIFSATLSEWQNRLKIDYTIKDQTTQDVHTKASTKQMAIKHPEQITQFESPTFILEKVDAWLSKNNAL